MPYIIPPALSCHAKLTLHFKEKNLKKGSSQQGYNKVSTLVKLSTWSAAIWVCSVNWQCVYLTTNFQMSYFFMVITEKKNPLLIMASSPFPFSQLLALLYCCSQLTLYLSSILIGALEKIIGFGFCDIQTNQGRRKCYQPSQRLRLMTLTKTLIIPDFTKT